MRTLPFVGFVLLALVCAGPAVGQAEDPEILAYVSGGSTGKVFQIDTAGTSTIFSAHGGFKPGSLTSDGSGRLFVCDKSSSEIHLLEQDSDGEWGLTTIFDKNMYDPPTPEQPVACQIVGDDLYFGERSGSGDVHGVWVLRGAASTPTNGVFNAPELLISIPLTSGDEVTSIYFAPNAQVLMAIGNRVLVAGPPGWDSFEPLIEDLSGEVSALAVNSVGEIFVAFADLGFVEVFDGMGNSCGIYTDVSPLRPTGMQFDLGDNLFIAAPKQSNDRNGDVLIATPNGGPATRQCDFTVPTVTAVPLTDDAPAAESDVVLPPSAVSVQLVFEDADALTAKLCSALFAVDPEFLNELPDPDCVLTITCRQMPLAEFETRTQADFPDTECFQIPNAGNNCIEMIVDGAECFGGITEIEWIFFVVADVLPEDRPGLLFSHETGPAEPYVDNILTGFEPIVPDLPNDPAVIGRRGDFGSGLVGVTNAPNRPPVAEAGSDQTLECSSGTGTVTIDGSASFDDDPIDADTLTFFWSGSATIPDGAEDDAMFVVNIADLGVGTHTYTLTVTDSGLFSAEGLLTDSDTVTITVNADDAAPSVDAVVADPVTLWPPNHALVPVTLSVDASDACDPAVSCEIVDVTSTDPVGGPDDPDTGDGGSTFPDWIITGALTVDLRAERSEGGDSVNDTRIYTVFVTCTDAAGNTTPGSVEVGIVSDQGN